MAKTDLERIREYNIPMNFIDESRVINGMFKTRNFIEGCFLAALVGLPCWVGVHAPFEMKISLVVGLALPFFLVGISGINGDPLSTFLRNAVSWMRARGTMLYNYETRALAQAPIKTMMEEAGMNDRILDFVDSIKEKAAQKRRDNPLVEGEDFVFAEDRSLSGNYLDEVESKESDDRGPVVSKQDVKAPPIMAVDAEVLDVDVETVSLISNVGEPEDSIDLFAVSDAAKTGPEQSAQISDPVAERPTKQVTTQHGAPTKSADSFSYDDSEDGALF